MAPSLIGHYRIRSKLGECGMGEVYRATDTKLGRDVAIKVLPGALAADARRVDRFQREAQGSHAGTARPRTSYESDRCRSARNRRPRSSQ